MQTIKPKMTNPRQQVQPQSGVEKAFGQAMRKVCKRQNLSQMDPNIATGLDRTFISDLESGIQGPNLHSVFRVAKGLEISTAVFVEAPRDLLNYLLCRWQVTSYRQSMAISQYLQ
jgi:transcriptional regulator with XRE-family HTH domain